MQCGTDSIIYNLPPTPERPCMKTKIVYILTCREDMTCVTMLIMSLYSLKKQMKGDPDLEVLTVMDSITHRLLKECNSLVLSESKPVVVDPPPEYDQMSLSRYLKTTLREIVQGDFLFIDCDTLIADSLNEIDDMDTSINIAAVADKNIENKMVEKNENGSTNCRNAGFMELGKELGINSGVLFVRDTPLSHDFFRTWHNNWKISLSKGVPFDQPAMWETNRTMGHPIKILSGIWNCQFATLNPDPNRYVRKAKVLHYYRTFYCGRFLLSIQNRVMKNGKVGFFDALFLRYPLSIVYSRRIPLFFWKLRNAPRKK